MSKRWQASTRAALAVVLCSCAGPTQSGVEREADNGGMGSQLADAVRQDDLGTFDLTDAALIASGINDAASLREARAQLERLIDPIVRELKRESEEDNRGRLLLSALHAKGGLLGQYDARATSLAEILHNRRYNCVSASVIYNVLAERLDLNVAAQLLPTHARSLLSAEVDGALQRIVVETTSPLGFDPDPRQQQTILAAVAGPSADGRAIVSDKGEIVGTLVLIGTIYVNRASIAQEAGQLERAERLFARGEAFATTEAMRTVLRDQRAALMSQLGADDLVSEDPERFPRAYRTLVAAVALGPKQKRVRAAVLQNLRAAAERMITLEAQKGSEDALLSLAGEAASAGLRADDRAGLRAFALSEVARIRMEKGDASGAVEAIDLALREQLSAADAQLKSTLEQNRLSTLRWAALIHAKKGAYDESLRFIERIEALPDLKRGDRRESKKDRLRVIHLVGNKRIDENDFEGAAEVYREGVRRFPSDATSRHNLVAALERITARLVDRTRCSQARQYIEEIKILDPKSKFPKAAMARCLMERARNRLEAKDYAEAVSLMRAAFEVRPRAKAVKRNLAIAILKWTRALAESGDCSRAKKKAKEVRRLASDISSREIARALKACR